jgi:hypothetical protein
MSAAHSHGLYTSVLHIKQFFASLESQADAEGFFIDYCRQCEHVLHITKDSKLFESMIQAYFAYHKSSILFRFEDVKESIVDTWNKELEDATTLYTSLGDMDELEWVQTCNSLKRKVFISSCALYEIEKKERSPIVPLCRPIDLSGFANGC